MGRYQAPQGDDDDDYDQGVTPMVIDDEDEDDDEHYERDDSQSLVWRNKATHFATITEHSKANGGSDDVVWRDESCHYLLKSKLIDAPHSRAVKRTFSAVAAVIISIVLHCYAPPPPLIILTQSPFSPSTLTTDYAIDPTMDCSADLHSPKQSIHDNWPGLIGFTQHETWAGYSRHLITHLLIVSWYALSNSFRYAWDEIIGGYYTIDYFHESSYARHDYWLQIQPMIRGLMSTIDLIWSHFKQAMTAPHDTTAMENTKDDDNKKLDLISERLLSIPAAHGNRKGRSSRRTKTCLNDTSTVDSNMIETPWSTEDYLRQTIGTSLSPQNLALKIISERIDSWGISSSSEDSSVEEYSSSSWILPPAIGFLLVGSDGVGKQHTARR